MADEKTPVTPQPAAAAFHLTPEQNKQQMEAAKASREEHQKTATEGVKAREAATQKSNEQYYADSEGRKPTPTPEEIDLMKVGALDIDAKEDDGSGPEMVQVTIRVPSREGDLNADPKSRNAEGGAPGRYKTRDVNK
jgi:hypothetical protein